MKCKDNLNKIKDQRSSIDELTKRVESNENIINTLLNKITKLQNNIEVQKCYMNVSQRVNEELKLQFDHLSQEHEERLVIVGIKIGKDETPGSPKRDVFLKPNEVIDKGNLTELSDISHGIKSIYRIGRKKGDSQDILLVLNDKIAKKKVYNNRKRLTTYV